MDRKQRVKKDVLPRKLGMLVLARNLKEPVFILCPDGNRIEITIEDIRGNQARIGFIAPKAYDIVRHDAVDHNGRQYLQTEPEGM